MSAATISCPWCAKSIEANSDLQPGTRVHCPRCAADFAVTAADLRAAALGAPPPPPTALVAEIPPPAPATPVLPAIAEATPPAAARRRPPGRSC